MLNAKRLLTMVGASIAGLAARLMPSLPTTWAQYSGAAGRYTGYATGGRCRTTGQRTASLKSRGNRRKGKARARRRG